MPQPIASAPLDSATLAFNASACTLFAADATLDTIRRQHGQMTLADTLAQIALAFTTCEAEMMAEAGELTWEAAQNDFESVATDCVNTVLDAYAAQSGGLANAAVHTIVGVTFRAQVYPLRLS